MTPSSPSSPSSARRQPLHPGIDPSCPRCRGAGYHVRRDGELAIAEACSCVRTCPSCRGTGWVAAPVDAPQGTKLAVGHRGRRVRCACQALPSRIERWNEAGIPGRHATSTRASFQTPAKGDLWDVKMRVSRYVTRDWQAGQDNRGLVLWGDVGRGKTHLMVAILHDLVFLHGASVRFVEFSHLLSDIKSGFGRGEGEAGHLEPLVRVDVLAIDELGKGRNTEFEGTVLDELVSRRYNAARPILGTTNFPPRPPTGMPTGDPTNGRLPALGDRVSARVYSRLMEMCDFVEVRGDDWRQRAALGDVGGSASTGPGASTPIPVSSATPAPLPRRRSME